MRGAAQSASFGFPDAKFLLTRLMRGAALPFRAYALIWNISTHAPHARRGILSSIFA